MEGVGLEVILAQELDRCVQDIKRRHIAAGQRVTGKTMNALEVRIKREGESIIGEIWGRPFTGALETGSRPARRKGTAQGKLDMVAGMKEWVHIRGLDAGMTEKQSENLAKYLSWYIKRYGSSLWRQGGRRDIITPAVEATRQALEERLSVYFEQLVSENVDNYFFQSK